jgi:PKHD-type hydroxylase
VAPKLKNGFSDMLIHIANVLTAEELATCRAHLAEASWTDGRATAGQQSAKVKANLQLAEDSAEARDLGQIVVRALERNPFFMAAALPRHVFPPNFNRYEPGMTYGAHVDNAIRQVGRSPLRLRTDVSATLFLSDPADYDGGELIIDGAQSVKLPAGDLVVYAATSLHRVAPVTRGARNAAFFWVQSMVKDESERALLFELDRSIVELNRSLPDNPALVRLTACYHNLLRRWADM